MKKSLLAVLTLSAMLIPAAAFAYSEGSYYSEGDYYDQGYYQSYYQSTYTAQQVVDKRSLLDSCASYPWAGLGKCNDYDISGRPVNSLEISTRGSLVFRATTNGQSYALSSDCRSWNRNFGNYYACVADISGGSLPATILSGTSVTLEFWNRGQQYIGYYNGCTYSCGDQLDWN